MRQAFWLVLLVLVLVGCVPNSPVNVQSISGFKTLDLDSPVVHKESDIVKGCSWNLQIFGMKKAKDDYVMGEYNKTLSKLGCDFIVVQEIRDENSVESFGHFCNMFPGFTCLISSRAGRSSSKEQFGVLYNGNLKLNGVHDFNPDKLDRWERPPFLINFSNGNLSFDVVVVHVKPDKIETKKEIKALEDEFGGFTDKISIWGDTNAACDYMSLEDRSSLFKNWTWFIPDEADTTSGVSKCAFDRIISNPEMRKQFTAVGVWVWDVPLNVSDHYPIWGQIRK